MPADLNNRLLGTRDRLLSVCDELNLSLDTIPTKVWQCINCSIWTKNVFRDELDDSTFCLFCADDNNFKT